MIDVLENVVNVWAPPPMLTVSQWADEYRRLSSEASAEPGRWRTDRAPYQRGIMDALSDPTVHTVVVMSSAQVGKSEILLNSIGYFIQQDPSPILALQPTLEMAEAFSKDRIAPMVRDTPSLSTLIADSRSRDSGNTLLHKKFPGGHITLAGANSPASLASRPVRIVLADEVDRYPVSAGAEGDPVMLAIARTKTFWNRKVVLTSTPTVAGKSRIEKAWNESDQRRYVVPCPGCGVLQPLAWARIDQETAEFACCACGSVISESEKVNMIRLGRWEASAPFNGTAGFHLNELYSPWRTWANVVFDYHRTKADPEQHKTWVNTSLGEPYEEEIGEAPELTALSDRVEFYGPVVPMGAGVLTAGVDVQMDRLEVEVVAWGVGGESWGVEYAVLWGDTRLPSVWYQLDSHLMRTWDHAGGKQMHLSRAFVDMGYLPNQVAKFCAPRRARGIYGIKGSSNAEAPEIQGPNNQKHGGIVCQVYTLGVNKLKTQMFAYFGLNTPGPGYCHLPDTYPPEWYEMLQAEHVVEKKSGGKTVNVWEKKKTNLRNESIDLRNYAMAAFMSLRVNIKAAVAALAENVVIPVKRQSQHSTGERTTPSWFRDRR